MANDREHRKRVFGREGGLTGGMLGSWLIGGTLAAGTVAGIMSRGKFGAAANGVKTIGRLIRGRIDFLNKASLTNKDTDAFIPILKRAKKGKLSREDRIWLKKKSDFYENKAKNSLPFEKDHKAKNRGLRGNPNPSPKAEQPAPSNTPVTQASQKAGNPKRTNPNVPAMSPLQKDALSKLTKGKVELHAEVASKPYRRQGNGKQVTTKDVFLVHQYGTLFLHPLEFRCSEGTFISYTSPDCQRTFSRVP